MFRSRRSMAIMFAAAFLAAGSAASACFMRSVQPVQVWLDHITVDITDNVAVKTYECTFKNSNPQAVVGGTCYMELEPGAQVDDMSVLVDGQEMKADILDVDKAKEVFADIVKNGGSPALLEYFGNQLIQTQVPRIAPNGTVTVKLKYTMALKKPGGLVRMQMLNTNPKALLQPLQSASVTINIKSKEPIKNVYSPTHELKLVEKEGWDVSAEWKQENYLPKHPFVFYFQTSEDDVAASLVAHREPDEEGTFMLLLSPTKGSGAGRITDSQILPKDVVFTVDTSGSMITGNKMEQARAALKYCLESLRPGDRFNIVDFSTTARSLEESGLVEVTNDSKQQALRYADKLAPRGGTAIQEALDLSLKLLGNEGKESTSDSSSPSSQSGSAARMKMILFATDGLPTIGERDPEAILKNMAKRNTDGVRLFVFGEGFDVNTKLLDFLALDHRGEADYILPEEKIEEKIGRFFDRVGSPVMTDLELRFEGLEVKDVFPRTIPDVFKGEQVIVYGRYTGHGEKTVKLTGTVAGRRETFEYTLDFPEMSEDDKQSFVPRLWAGRKVDDLLNEIRKNDKQDSKELVDEVTHLAKRYGIITPYTSFLMAEDVAGKPMNEVQLGRQLGARLRAASAPAAADVDKVDRVKEAKGFAEMRRENARGGLGGFDAAAEKALQDFGRKDESSLSAIRSIGARTFYKRGAEWQESLYDPAEHKEIKELKVGSEEYFQLLMENEGVAKYLALGDVVFEVKGTWYRIRS